jgi:hypothetical protein
MMTGNLYRAAGRLTSKQVDGAIVMAGTRPAGVATFWEKVFGTGT